MKNEKSKVLNNSVLNALMIDYIAVYDCDLVNQTMTIIKPNQNFFVNHQMSALFKKIIESDVCLEHQGMMEEFFDRTTLSSRLHNNSISIDYRSSKDIWHQGRFLVKSKNEYGEIESVLYVVRQIDKEKELENRYKQELIKNNRVLAGLSIDYTIAFVLNLDTDDYNIVFTQQTNHAKVIEHINKFTDYVNAYVDQFVLSYYQQPMRHTLNRLDILKRFETEDEYYFSFETVPNAAGLSCFQAHIVKEYDGDEHYAFLGFRTIDEIVKKERYYKEALEEANKALQRELDMISFALPGGVKISNDDETYSFKYVSKQFAQMLGYSTADELMEASKGTIVGLAHPDDLETGIAEALEQYTKADHYEITYRMKCKDGSWKYIEDRGHKIINNNGVVEHWNLILDKNELMEKTIALETEKRTNQIKTEFLSRMSHDMRTPLNGIIGLIDISMKHPDQRELVDSNRIKERIAANHLLSLVNDTLELSKLENKDTPLSKEVFHVPTLLHEIETIAQMQGDGKGITVLYTGDLNQFKHPYLIGSPLYIKQILLNIITNGIKYNHKNGFVYCSVEEKIISSDQSMLQFTIRDTGIGMKKSFLENIFKPFVQEDEGPRSHFMGTGLGMAIVKNLVDLMNGTIRIESKEHVGTTVHIDLPFEITKLHSLNKIADSSVDIDHSKMNILIVEDNDLNREITKFILEDEGIHVTEAIDGKQALDIFNEKPEYYFNGILMDIMMPKLDGYQATKAIRSSHKKDAKTIPIVAISAKAFDEDIKLSKSVGMNAHLSKPINGKQLIETIDTYCYLYQ